MLLAGAVAAALAGAALVIVVLADVFLAVIVPRAVGGRWRPSANLSRRSWGLFREHAIEIRDEVRREDRLALFAPAILIFYLVFWVGALIFGYAVLFWVFGAGIKPAPSFEDALYFSGTSLLTIGYGDFVPVWPLTRFLAIFEAANGLAVLAITTTFLFQLFAAFGRREAYIVAVSERFGAPPSGLEFLVRHARYGLQHDELRTVLRDGQNWIAEVMESHLAYPVLTYFRSSHDNESWIGSLGALLDLATLPTTTTDLDTIGEAHYTLGLGAHFVRDFAAYFRFPRDQAAGVEEHEFATAYAQLRDAGIPLRPFDQAWPAFTAARATYAGQLDAMARWWRIPPARWIGDRSHVRARIDAAVM